MLLSFLLVSSEISIVNVNLIFSLLKGVHLPGLQRRLQLRCNPSSNSWLVLKSMLLVYAVYFFTSPNLTFLPLVCQQSQSVRICCCIWYHPLCRWVRPNYTPGLYIKLYKQYWSLTNFQQHNLTPLRRAANVNTLLGPVSTLYCQGYGIQPVPNTIAARRRAIKQHIGYKV